jgi:hypothetical protein
VTTTIFDTLGTMPSGRVVRMTMDTFTQYLRERFHPDIDAEKHRREEARRRLDLYKDRGSRHFEAAIDKAFKNNKNRQLRKDLLEFAEFQNITKRIVRETSTVYSEPAHRKIRQANERYQRFQREALLDRRMRKANRLANLLNHALVIPDVVMGVPVMQLVTTDKFVPVPHPLHPTIPVAYIVDQFPTGMGGAGMKPSDLDPHYLVITEHEYIKLDKNWRYVEHTYSAHGFGMMPALLLSKEEVEDGILDTDSGKDLISGHIAVALLNVMMLKHQKSGTKVPYASGDMSTTARGQTMDEEGLIEVGEGVMLSTLDMGADPRTYIDATRAVIKQLAANYGIPESVFDMSYQATSGYEIRLKRTGLLELRRDQILDFRPFEAKLAELWSKVLSAAASEWAYNPSGWSIAFGDVDAPDAPLDKLTYWEKLEQLGLANRVEMYLDMNPEATEDEAKAAIAANLGMRIDHMRRMQSANGGVFGPAGSANPPATRDGGRVTLVPADDEEEAA